MRRVTRFRRSPYPRYTLAIGLALVALGILGAGLVGASTAAAWGGLAALAVLFAASRVQRTRSRSDWAILGGLILVVLIAVALITWIYLADIQVGS